ncbi:MAG TPA: right-handed parallel beta-helix repeat-containing protein [Candidatus Eisenbacteria bacterium]|jgi:hypothetical protein|nr:right-handed parallel beta-helix repeat-containing protein [Candidatus Eisenbacteria bacterium]
MRLGIAALCSIMVSQEASAAVLHVPADYPTIALAVAAAVSGDEVLVAPGTYHETLVLNAAQDGIQIHSESGPAVTILDGSSAGVVVTMNSVGSATELIGFTITNGAGNPAGGISLVKASPKIQGNLITGNTGLAGGIDVQGPASPAILDNELANNHATFAGGAFAARTEASPDVENNFIHDNRADISGGGAYFVSSGGLFTNNRVLSNTSQNGAGVYLSGLPYLTIQQCLVQSNIAKNIGGGIYVDRFSGSIVQDCQILSNTAAIAGGMYVAHSVAEIHRNLIEDNLSLNGSGGGIYLDKGSDATVDNNVVARNQATAGFGGGIEIAASTGLLTNNTVVLNQADLPGGNVYVISANVQMQRCILSHSPGGGMKVDGSSVTVTCTDAFGNAGGNYIGIADPTGGNGNISSDPLYCDLSSLDFHLNSVSPCTAALASPCSMIGALDVGCSGPVPTQSASWGSIKAKYR